jgi:general secretion pathway protein M
VSALADRFAKLEPRERTLLFVLGGMLAFGIVVVPPVALHQSVSAARDEAQAIRDTLDKIDESREKLAKKRATQEALLARYGREMPALATFVEEAAQAHQVDIAESQARPDIPHGKKYVEHTVSVKLRKVGLLGLSKMLEKIEKSGYPVAVTKLNIKPRAGENDSYDVELHVASFERKDAKPKKSEAAEPSDEEGSP